ncbi:MAG: M23 family metallopeptidase [Bacilli bacterium]|nr:M23 family metallopeptidase [Bacilli bacterium]
MKRKRLKPFVFPLFSGLVFGLMIMCIAMLQENIDNKVDNNYTYVNDSIIDNSLPVMSEEDVVIRPYRTDKIDIYKKFYDENNKEEGIVYYNGTYIQNSGIIYNSTDEFDVVSILDGDVIDVKIDEILGNVIEIKHSNGLISSYSGLKSMNVSKGDKVLQGTIIGKSGEITLDVNLKNALLFEIIKDGKYENPDNYFDKKVKEL